MLSALLTLVPLAGFEDLALLIVRVTIGIIMVKFGWGKIKDPAANSKDFEENIAKPGWLFGNLVLITEFFGGIAIILGLLTSLAALAIAGEMVVGTFVKAFKWKLDFGDYSYDILIFVLCLVVLAFGAGAYALAS